ncbi:MAG TPA: DUF190 domain-containing protein [Acidimicrobiales bacterium]|nr:DUF190 domain-containing protein [Acidimicrobiales bacterium]
MSAERTAVRLVIFLTEDDRVGHREACDVLLERAREDGMAGATIWRGVEGFGRSGHLRTARLLDGSQGLPVIVELIDSAERIEAFLPVVSSVAPGALVTKEAVHVVGHPPQAQAPLDDPGAGGQRVV